MPSSRGATDAPERPLPPEDGPPPGGSDAFPFMGELRRPPQAPAGAVLHAADGHAAARHARAVAAGDRPRRALPGHPHGAVPEGVGARRARRDRGAQRAAPDRGPRLVRLPRLRAAVRALGPVRGPRSAPGADADRRRAVPDHRRGARLRARQRAGLPELLHLLRLAVLRRGLRGELPLRLRVGHGLDAPGRRLPAPRGARGHRRAHRRGRPRARLEPGVAGQRHRLRVADRASRQRPALARRAARHRPDRHRAQGRRGHHRRPGVPRAGGHRARRPVPPAWRDGPHRALDDGDPRPPRRVRARAVGAPLRAAPAGLRGLRLRAQAHLRPRRARGCCCSCSARCSSPAPRS